MTRANTPTTVVPLDRFLTAGLSGDGVHWSVDRDVDLNVNLAHLDPGSRVAAHVNDEVDVLLVVPTGSGQILIDGSAHSLAPHVLVVVGRGTRRAMLASSDGLTYLTIHRSRPRLGITRRPSTQDAGGDPPCWAHLIEDDAEASGDPAENAGE